MKETMIQGGGEWGAKKINKQDFKNAQMFNREDLLAQASPEQRAKMEAAFAAGDAENQNRQAMKKTEEQVARNKPEEIRQHIQSLDQPSKRRGQLHNVMMMSPEESKKMHEHVAAIQQQQSEKKESGVKKWLKNLFS